MQSQVNALLRIVSGILADCCSEYPALKVGFSHDYERIALNCQTRGLGFFTLDLPSLDSMLLHGLETGRLVLGGPATRRVSSKIRVPRLFSGLWLRVFDKSACLKQDADVTALAFLRQLCAIGKKLEQPYTHSRLQATIGVYHDIERTLRLPTLEWECDRITSTDESASGLSDIFRGVGSPADDQYCYLGSSDRSGCDILLSALPKEALRKYHLHQMSVREPVIPDLKNVHLAQAYDRSDVWNSDLPLFKDRSVPNQCHSAVNRVLDKIQQVADLIVGSMDILQPILYSEIGEGMSYGSGFKHGPGAVSEGIKNHDKSRFKTWPNKLQGVFPYELCGRTATQPIGDRLTNHEPASRLIAVPKTVKGPRLIAAEPVAHQWCQQLVLRFLFEQCESLFEGSFIDFKDQSKSGDMVLEASLDGSLATVDLSDASDRLSCWTVERIFRSNPSILLALHAARTRYIRDNISDVPSFLKARKFASQGTATTFPVMSLTMLCIALGCCLEGDVTWENIKELRDHVRVFGDDIILPTRGYSRLMLAMEALQLRVNMTKSYSQGSFRESCGVDGYIGHTVTPVKPKSVTADSPSEVQALIDLSNNLFLKGFWRASESVLGLIPWKIRSNLLIDKVGTDGLRGLASYSGSCSDHLYLRWNDQLHRFEARAWSSYSRPTNNHREGYDALLDFVSRRHSVDNPRIVSQFIISRTTKSRRSWVTVCPGSIIAPAKRGLFHRVLSRMGHTV